MKTVDIGITTYEYNELRETNPVCIYDREIDGFDEEKYLSVCKKINYDTDYLSQILYVWKVNSKAYLVETERETFITIII